MQALMPLRRRLRHRTARICRPSSTAARWTWSRPATSTFRPCSATATWWPAWWARSSARIFGQTDPRTTAYAHKLGLAFQLTNIIRDVGEDAHARPHLPAGQRAAAVRRQGARDPQPQVFGPLHGADAVPGRARPPPVRRGAGAAARRRPAQPEARPDDGQHLPHAAARNRARRLPGAAPAREPDARCASSGWRGKSRRWAGSDRHESRRRRRRLGGHGRRGGGQPGPGTRSPSSRPRARWAAAPAACRCQLPDGAQRHAGQRPAHPDRRLPRHPAR